MARHRAAGLEVALQPRKPEGHIKDDRVTGPGDGSGRRKPKSSALERSVGHSHNNPTQRGKLTQRFGQFMKLPGANTLIDGLSMYVARCLPFPARTTYHRWVISVLPQEYFANLSVGSQWTVNCLKGTDGPPFRFLDVVRSSNMSSAGDWSGEVAPKFGTVR
jgi:hypothetical protein